jgi:DNA-directed RNA polymerase specialized sigma24 family protein
MHYCDPAQLRTEITEYRRTGIMSPELVRILAAIIRGVQLRYWGDPDDDVSQLIWLRLLRVLPQVDVTQNCFAWLTAVARNETLQVQRFNRRTRWGKTIMARGELEWLADDRAQVGRYAVAVEPPEGSWD